MCNCLQFMLSSSLYLTALECTKEFTYTKEYKPSFKSPISDTGISVLQIFWTQNPVLETFFFPYVHHIQSVNKSFQILCPLFSFPQPSHIFQLIVCIPAAMSWFALSLGSLSILSMDNRWPTEAHSSIYFSKNRSASLPMDSDPKPSSK